MCSANKQTIKLLRPAIEDAIKALAAKHKEHITNYGDKLEERLTGQHETSSINEFSSGNADRGRSIRIPRMVAEKGPAMADAYARLASKLIEGGLV